MKPQSSKSLLPILLVDDDADCRWLVRESLAQRQVDNPLFEASTGTEAMEFLLQRGSHSQAPRPGLVLLDIEMPGMNGHEVLRQISGVPQLKGIPVVMLTGMREESHKCLAGANGASSYIVKPETVEELGDIVASTARQLLASAAGSA
jgi:CheY-like chemotaxis protein